MLYDVLQLIFLKDVFTIREIINHIQKLLKL